MRKHFPDRRTFQSFAHLNTRMLDDVQRTTKLCLNPPITDGSYRSVQFDSIFEVQPQPVFPSLSTSPDIQPRTAGTSRMATSHVNGSANGGRATDLDVLVIGGGFGGCYMLKLLRDNGYNTKLVEAAPRIGGVWAWNRYPGARVDVEVPYYGFSHPEIWSTWM